MFESWNRNYFMNTLTESIKSFNRNLTINTKLPKGISVLNPFQDNARVFDWSDGFYDLFYSDCSSRRLVLGINPGRLGAGQTGIPFTDTKRLFEYFGFGSSDNLTHEASSAFVYRMIDSFGGPELFYSRFLVSSVCPLGFVINRKGRDLNFNYYDSPQLMQAVTPFIVQKLEEQLKWPIDRSVVYCLGTGKNLDFLDGLNEKHRWFRRIEALEHPRYIMQYKSSRMDWYIEKYIRVFNAK